MTGNEIALDCNALKSMKLARRKRLDANKGSFGDPVDIDIMSQSGMVKCAVFHVHFIIPQSRWFPTVHPDVVTAMVHVHVV
jgi:hypothetical protein